MNATRMGGGDGGAQDIGSIKRAMTLDLDSAGGGNTRPKRLKNGQQLAAAAAAAAAAVPVLSSPDLHRLALASPEVEKFIKGSLTPISTYMFPAKNPTTQQTQFVRGFEEALEQCKRRGSLNPMTSGGGGGGVGGCGGDMLTTLGPATTCSGAVPVPVDTTATLSTISSAAGAATAATTITTAATTTAAKTGAQAGAPAVALSTTPPPSLLTLAPAAAAAATTITTSATPPTTTTTFTTLTSANLHSLNVQMGTVASSQSSTLSSVETHSSDTSDSMSTMPLTSGATMAMMIKDEQTVPNTLDPIDMRDQEKMKLERKRLRNRIAASKCRQKKIERISQLEDQVGKLKDENLEYEHMIAKLRAELQALRQEALMHQQHGCHIEL